MIAWEDERTRASSHPARWPMNEHPPEPIWGYGLHSDTVYEFGENEMVIPLRTAGVGGPPGNLGLGDEDASADPGGPEFPLRD